MEFEGAAALSKRIESLWEAVEMMESSVVVAAAALSFGVQRVNSRVELLSFLWNEDFDALKVKKYSLVC